VSRAVIHSATERDWWTRPRVVLPLLGALVVLIALLTPQRFTGRDGDPRLSSHLAGSLGARVLAETAARFGYAVEMRDLSATPDPTTGRTIHAVLAPRVPLTDGEAHAYLEAVRGGDALLLVFEDHGPLSDSLGLWRTSSGGVLQVAAGDSAGCSPRRDFVPPLWMDGRVHLLGVQPLRGPRIGQVSFAPLLDDTMRQFMGHAAIGFRLGQGRVIALADPDLLRNDVLRRCEWGADAIAMRLLEWLRAGGPEPRTALVFDEYHQGFGRAPSLTGLIAGFLVGHPVGRAVLLVTIAGLVLLLAAAPRALPPRDRETMERRDPLEQVDALAHAYEQVRATRTATARLLHGVRSRLRGAPGHHLDDDTFLSAVQSVVPERADDVALIRRALREQLAARDLPELGDALRRLEESLTTTNA
jgi:hypothetical protein